MSTPSRSSLLIATNRISLQGPRLDVRPATFVCRHCSKRRVSAGFGASLEVMNPALLMTRPTRKKTKICRPNQELRPTPIYQAPFRQMNFVQCTWHFSIAFRKTKYCDGSRRWLKRSKTLQFHRVQGILVRASVQPFPWGPHLRCILLRQENTDFTKLAQIDRFQTPQAKPGFARAAGESLGQILGRRSQESGPGPHSFDAPRRHGRYRTDRHKFRASSQDAPPPSRHSPSRPTP